VFGAQPPKTFTFGFTRVRRRVVQLRHRDCRQPIRSWRLSLHASSSMGIAIHPLPTSLRSASLSRAKSTGEGGAHGGRPLSRLSRTKGARGRRAWRSGAPPAPEGRQSPMRGRVGVREGNVIAWETDKTALWTPLLGVSALVYTYTRSGIARAGSRKFGNCSWTGSCVKSGD
jgi:hypothetical protein